jgi:hypothetical protein
MLIKTFITRIKFKHLTAIKIFALIGAAVATTCDMNHAFTGALHYPSPAFLKQAWWVFPMFTLVFIIMSLTYLVMVNFMPSTISHSLSKRPGDARSFIEAMIPFVLVYLLSGFGYKNPLLLSIIFYSLFIVRLLFTYERRFLLWVAILLAVGGMLGEGVLTKLDMVKYTLPEVFGVPYWLGGLYVHGAFVLREGMKFFVYKKMTLS